MTQPLGNRRPEADVIPLVFFLSDARWLRLARKQRAMADALKRKKHAQIAATEAV
jgi:hypothetical protein